MRITLRARCVLLTVLFIVLLSFAALSSDQEGTVVNPRLSRLPLSPEENNASFINNDMASKKHGSFWNNAKHGSGESRYSPPFEFGERLK